MRRAGRLLFLLCTEEGDAASDQITDTAAAAGEILDEIGWAFKIFFKGGLEELACKVLPGQEDLFYRKVGALLTRILTVIAGRKATQSQEELSRSSQKFLVYREELRIASRTAWNCLHHMDVAGITIRNGDEVILSTLEEVELKALQYFDLSLNPLPYEKGSVGFEMPSGTAIFQLHDADDWLVGRRYLDGGKYQTSLTLYVYDVRHFRDCEHYSYFVNKQCANDSLDSMDQILLKLLRLMGCIHRLILLRNGWRSSSRLVVSNH